MKLHGILEAALYVDDLDAAETFYRDVLGLERISRNEGRSVFLRCGESVVLLFDPETTSTVRSEVGGAPIPKHGTRGDGHLAFRVTEDELDAWRARLRAADVAIESEVTWPGGARSFYFRDPAGNSLEIAVRELWFS